MPIVVDVVSQEDYEAWLAANAGASTSDIKSVAQAKLTPNNESVAQTK